jgi:signal transduction histidine kinase
MTAPKVIDPALASPSVHPSGTFEISAEQDMPSCQEPEAALRDELQMCASDARELVEASDAVKELFVAIVGHDLRGPLSTVLASAHVLAENPDLPATARQGVDRILRSGERMRRLVEQLLEAARARQPGGIPVTLGPARDLRQLVARIVDEVRASNPDRLIVQRNEGPALARFDADRVEQVVSNLLGNAVVHGDPNRPIAIWVDAHEGYARLSVHNFGTPIPPDFMGLLFDPFKRARGKRDESGGLGLGLYITERIMTAHGGSMSVTSTEDTGTCFEATFPRWPRDAGAP